MCREKSITHLNRVGCNVVRLPRENIDPLLILSRSNSHLETLGDISDFVIGDQPKPEIDRDQAAAKISGLKTDKFELGVGLRFLQRLLSYIGVGRIGLEATFKKADSVQFVYENVLIDSVLPAKIGRYLLSVGPDVSSPFMEHINDEGEAYVITETLKSNAFGVIAYDKSDVKLDIDISALRELLSATPKIGLSKDEKNVISFEGG